MAEDHIIKDFEEKFEIVSLVGTVSPRRMFIYTFVYQIKMANVLVVI
jgi:predicted DNA-binding protein with PD1-like motif